MNGQRVNSKVEWTRKQGGRDSRKCEKKSKREKRREKRKGKRNSRTFLRRIGSPEGGREISQLSIFCFVQQKSRQGDMRSLTQELRELEKENVRPFIITSMTRVAGSTNRQISSLRSSIQCRVALLGGLLWIRSRSSSIRPSTVSAWRR